MAIVCPNSAEVLLLKYMINHTAATDLVCHLYTSNIEPSETDTISTYSSSEPSDGSYTAATLAGAGWTVSTSSGVTSAEYASQYFSFSASASIYGVYYTNADSTSLILAERFDAPPYNVASSGGVVEINPLITLD